MSPAPGSDADVVRTYLEMLAVHRPRRGRKRTAESILRRMAVIDAKIPTVPPLAALHLAQERMDLEAELTALEHQKSAAAAERGFLQVAKRYAEQNGISYGAWRQAGVPVDVLRQAAISRPTR